MKWYILGFRKYFVFSGRSDRHEFWMFILFHYLFVVVIRFAEHFFGLAGDLKWWRSGLSFAEWFVAQNWGAAGIATTIYGVAAFVPLIAVKVRRLHDTDRSGVWLIAWWLIAAVIGVAVLRNLTNGLDIGDLRIVDAFNTAQPIMLGLYVLLYGWQALFFAKAGDAGHNRYGQPPVLKDN